MKYSISQLKKDAKQKNIFAEMIVRCGEKCTSENMPERLQGKRQLVYSNTVAIFFLNKDGKKSELQLPKASLIEYTNDTLTIYSPGYREPNETERRIINEWKKIEDTKEYQQRLEYDCLTDGSGTYWQRVNFFTTKNAEYLLGHKEQRGLKLDCNKRNRGEKDFIRDASIKGIINMQYKLERR